jgi:hypothetical protein
MARQIQRHRTAPPDVEAGEPEDYDDGPGGADDQRGSRRRSAARSEPARGSSGRARRRQDDEDLDERPARSSGRKRPSSAPEKETVRRAPRRSREDYSQLKAKHSYNSKDEMRITEEDTDYLFAFLDDAPIDMFYQHFIMELPKGVRKSYTCSETQDCPLCEYGDTPRLLVAYNVAEFDDDGEYEVKYFIATPSVQKQIDKLPEKRLPLNAEDNFFIVSKSEKKYTFERIASDDLEDYDVELSEEERSELLESDGFASEDVFKPDSRATLREAVRQLKD